MAWGPDGQDLSPNYMAIDGRLESESGLRREERVEDGGRKGGFGGRRGIWRRLVPSGGNPRHFRDPLGYTKPFRLGIPDPQFIPQVGSGDLVIWLSCRT